MDRGNIYIYTGNGRGKSAAAWGRAIQTATEGKRVVVIQFLKGKGLVGEEYIKRLEPEIKLFQFEKSEESFDDLTEEKKQEEIANICNGLKFANKVLSVEECDLLILDEVLGLVDMNIISKEDLISLLENRRDTDIILTGTHLEDSICYAAHEVSQIETVKFRVWKD